MSQKPSFIISIDTEGDDLWSRHKKITTKNINFIPRFQSLCESYGFKPTYLTTYEMAISPSFQEFGKDILTRNTGEIGMHLHAWNTPPIIPLTKNDFVFLPYLTEYSESVMRKKIQFQTNLLEKIFGVKMRSHRAGRYYLNEIYAKILVENGYCVDCTVTPHVSWKNTIGDPNQEGGPDYTNFPNDYYFLDLEDISRPGSSSLLEVPVTIFARYKFITAPLWRLSKIIPVGKSWYDYRTLGQRAIDHYFAYWLMPMPIKGSLNRMLWVLNKAIHEKRSYVEFTLHSSELMPGGSPTFTQKKDVEQLYRDLEILFRVASKNFVGSTLYEFYEKVQQNQT
ncbi:MAG: deacetylase [Candidatus Hodarchaeota archaeon]